LVLQACTSVEKVQHVEAVVTETIEQNAKGFFESTGYKKVNSITTIEEAKNYIKTDLKAIEDYYDPEGNYKRTEVIHTTFKKSNITQAVDSENRKEELLQPSTILLPDLTTPLDDITAEEKEKIKEHVLSFVDMLGN